MTNLKHSIEKIVTKKNIRILLSIFLVVGLFVGHTFAVSANMVGDGSTVNETVKDISKIITYIVQILSWVWIVLANLAGKFMTNTLLYGEFIHLDATLWTLWNIMKNFANYALGFILIVAILRGIVSQSGSSKVTDVVKKTLISGILIQMSWFIIGAAVDVSTILTTAVGSFPAQIIAADNESMLATNNGLKKLLNGNKFKFDSKGKAEIMPRGEDVSEDDMKALIDSILPSADSMAGPLIFIGISAFNFLDMPVVDNNETLDSVSDLILQIGLDGIVLLAYTVMMFFIFLFNLLRILVLWVVIPLTPLVVLMYVFGVKSSKLGETLGSFIKVENIVKLIFKPVLMVGALSLVLLVLVLVKNIINNDSNTNKTIEEVSTTINSSVSNERDNLYDSSMAVGGLAEFSMNGFKDGISDVLIYVLGLCLVYFVMKMAINSGTGIKFVDDRLEKLMTNVTGYLQNVPIIPVGGGKAVGWKTLSEAVERKPSSMIDTMRNDQNEILRNDDRFKWLFPNDNSGKIFSSLSNYMTSSREAFIAEAHDIAQKHDLILDRSPWINDKDNSFEEMKDKWNASHTNKNDQINGRQEIAEYKPKES